MGTVSVIVPTFNRRHRLESTIRSALAEDHVAEVLVCDDGSDDGSREAVEDVGDPRVRWIPGSRSGGPATPRNRGLGAATSRWVAFLDSDDEWLPGKLQRQLERVGRGGAAACSGNALRVVPGRDGPAELLHDALPYLVTLPQLLRANLVVTSSMLVDAELLRAVGGFPEQAPRTIFEDYACWLRVAQRTDIAVVDDPLVAYRDEMATSARGSMRLELTCTGHALQDFRRWRSGQDPPIRTTPAEYAAMARQLASLVSVRKILARGLSTARDSRTKTATMP